jgi:phosphatidylglycerophosphate synthase
MTTMSGGGAMSATFAWTFWQLGYACDCADGQLARVTRQSSVAGARLDVLCDVASQVALAVVVGAVWWAEGIHPVFALAFAATRSVATTISAINTSWPSEDLQPHRSASHRVLSLGFDFPVQVTVVTAALALNIASLATGVAIALASIAAIQLCRQIVLAATVKASDGFVGK